MLIHNITFVVDPVRTEEFLRWLHVEGVMILRNGQERELSVAILREVEGQVNPPDRGVSVALRTLFDGESALREWERNELERCLAAYREKFGPEALAFCTLLEQLDFIV